MPSNRDMSMRYEARKREDSRYRSKHNIPCYEYHGMPDVKEKSGYYKDNQIAFWSGHIFFKVSFQSGKLRLRRYHYDNIQRPETHILTAIDVPKGLKIDSGAKVSWFYTNKLLLLRFDDFPRKGCYAIAHCSYPPEVVAHLRKTMYGFLAEQHNAAVEKYRSDDDLIDKLRTEIQTEKERNTQSHTKDRSDSGSIKKLRKKIDIEKQRTTKLHSDVEYLKYQRATQQELHERELRELEKKHKQELSTRSQTLIDERLLKSTDFTFVCNDGKQVRAPRAVLASFWPRFENENSCQEKQKNVTTLNYSSEIVELMLSNLNGCKLECTKNQAFSLMHLALTYQLPELFQKVFKKLEQKLSVTEHILAWRVAALARNQEAQDFLTMRIVSMKGKKRKRHEIESIGGDEGLEMFIRVVAQRQV